MTSPPHSRFTATRWTLVLQAGSDTPEARTALGELCEIYYEPVVAFIRNWRQDQDGDAAREQAHAFFESILNRESLGRPDPEKGRFRSYLLGAVKNFLARQLRDGATAKRGGDAEHEPLDPDWFADAGPSNDAQFDRAWALTIVERALGELEAEMKVSGKAKQFEVLKPWLDGNAETPQSEAADALGLSGTAIKVAIHRLRERFREKVRTNVAATLHDPAELNAELSHLVAVLASDVG